MVVSPQHTHAIANTRLLMEAFAGVPLPEWEQVAEVSSVVTVERGEVVVPVHELHPYFYIVLRGVMKLRMVTRAGTPTIRFFAEGEVAGSYNALGPAQGIRLIERGLLGPVPDPRLSPQGSPFELLAVEPSSMVKIDFRILEQLSARHGAWARMLMSYQTALLLSLHAGLPDSHIGSAEERYRDFAQRRPDLIRRLSQREVAGHIGVTEVGMSRIVKRVNTAPATPSPPPGTPQAQE